MVMKLKNSGKQKAIILLWSMKSTIIKILTPIINQYEKKLITVVGTRPEIIRCSEILKF